MLEKQSQINPKNGEHVISVEILNEFKNKKNNFSINPRTVSLNTTF